MISKMRVIGRSPIPLRAAGGNRNHRQAAIKYLPQFDVNLAQLKLGDFTRRAHEKVLRVAV